MAKLVKCSQCKNIHFHLVRVAEGGEIIDEKEFGCKADISLIILEHQISMPQKCPLFRNKTLTAWQEVKQDIWDRIKSFPIIKLLINKLTNQ